MVTDLDELIFMSYFYSDIKTFRILFRRTVFVVFTQISNGVNRGKTAGIRLKSKLQYCKLLRDITTLGHITSPFPYFLNVSFRQNC